MAPAQDTMFRSADMSMVQLYISNEIGRDVVTALGELGLLQFRDLNGEVNAFQRTFTQEIRRLDNVERQLRYFYAQMEKAGIPLRKLDLDNERLANPSTSEIDELVERSQSLEQRVFQLNDSYETLKKREVELTEWRWVLREAGGFFDRAHGNVDEIRASTEEDDAPLLQDVEHHNSAPEVERSFSGMNIGFVAALPVVVTFPFLFAVMFGDLGHAIIMLSAALAMIYWEKPLKKVSFELFAMLYYGRYIALIMALFSLFTGLIYNDIFSKSLTLFDSAWHWRVPDKYVDGQTLTAALNDSGYRYPFGLDWMWHGTENDLLFSNSYKMKMSIILGWAHMTYSLIFAYVNARHFRKPVDIWGNFVPGMIFFQSIFGYLVLCIIYKWSVNWNDPSNPRQPPGLLNMLIYMFLSPGTLDVQLYPGQATVQVILLLLAFVQVPILLFLKPFWLRREHNRARGLGYRAVGETSRVSALDGDDEDDSNGHAVNGRPSTDSVGEGVAMITQDLHGDGEHEEFEFSEVMIHQIIHTIEFCLNCVSHTASYLRLWALSLAHQQLSVVLWSMTLGGILASPSATGITGGIMIVVAFYLWFVLTIAILVMMEGTSAMLHSLRLAWVESFSKFAEFAGWPFQPFSFAATLEESEELSEYLG
ncbi:V-type proton ATPase subunit a like protein [Verticillium longisporum]|uniref:V-type proton ATPase subunit a n=2 Tax=Verticillium longisporum TaxID=100787 RepID=A0A8I2ZNK2_VERLO|nr:V-type proton ATPase subunit a like protein [Verticillium longisporum]